MDLKKNICDNIKECEIKIGYREEEMNLYYPQASLLELLPANKENLSEALAAFCRAAEPELGRMSTVITSLFSGSNSMMICPANICTKITTISVIKRFKRSPVSVVFFTRSVLPAPMFCPAMAVTAWPTAQQGIPAKVLTFSPTPDAAATDTPNWFNMPVIIR